MAIRAYFDSSVLVKRYVNEIGSRSARSLFRRFRVVSCVLAPLEGLSACARLKSIGDLSERAFSTVMTRIGTDRRQWELVELNAPILAQAEQVLQRTQLRTLDALHLASALVFQDRSSAALPFITADERQRQAAQQMGLHVIWVATT
jgi:predicted nucleic acid-binding protein